VVGTIIGWLKLLQLMPIPSGERVGH
jgi:hypothetical protein